MSLWGKTLMRDIDGTYRKEDDWMSFVTISKEGRTLSDKQKMLLFDIESFDYPVAGYGNLGELHQSKNLSVELRGEKAQLRSINVVFKRADLVKRLQDIQKLLRKGQESCSLVQQRNFLEDLLEEMDEKGVDKLEKKLSMCVFGEYIREGEDNCPKIVLYMDAIGDSDELLAEVYVHEMHHALYDHDLTQPFNYVREVEEPLCEFGMLRFMKNYRDDLFDDALENVKDKRFGIASCYSFGAYLYENTSERSKNWLELMIKAKYILSAYAPLADEYKRAFKDGLYPLDEEHCAGLLLRLLYETASSSGSKYLFSKDLVKTIFTFGLGIDMKDRNALCVAVGKKKVVGDPSDDVWIRIDGKSFPARWEVVDSKGHKNGVMRIVWTVDNAVGHALEKKYQDLFYSLVSSKMRIPPYDKRTEVHLYHIDANEFELL